MASKSRWIYGRKPVIEALEEAADLEKILLARGASGEAVQHITRLARMHGIPIQHVPTEKLNREVKGNHQGVLAMQSAVHYYQIEDVLPTIYEKGEVPLILLLDQITDVRNIGAIARTAYGAGAHALVVPDKGSAPMHGDAMKASAGALEHLAVCRHQQLDKVIRTLQTNGLLVVGMDGRGDKQLKDLDLTQPVAIVMGSEEQGMGNETLRTVDHLAVLPMFNQFDSYNVSVAAGMALYEVMRQRLS